LCDIILMGKSKKRILHKTNSSIFMTREGAVSKVLSILSSKKNDRVEAHNIITLFGLEAEELSEAGIDYENLKALEGVVKE